MIVRRHYATIIGIDPGLTGAIAVHEPVRDWAQIIDLPTQPKTSGKGQQLDAGVLAAMLRGIQATHAPLHAYIERQRPMPKQGTVSVMSLGQTVGVIEGVCASLGIARTYVEPAAWKRKAGLIKQGKGASRQRAAEAFPALAEQFTRARDDGRAEALLIAMYGPKLNDA